MNKPIVFGLSLCVAACVSVALAVTTGTPFTATLYDQLAQKYQSPPLTPGTLKYGDDSGIATGALNTYNPLTTMAFAKSGDAKVAWYADLKSAEAAGYKYTDLISRSSCTLLNGAALADRMMRNSVHNLENLVDNPTLKTMIVDAAADGVLYLEYSTLESSSDDKTKAVAVAGSRRVPAAEVLVTDRSVNTSQYSTTYTIYARAKFKVADLEKAGAIQGNKVTFQHGWRQSDFCTFDLSQLP